MANTKKPKSKTNSKTVSVTNPLSKESVPFKYLPLKMQVKKLHKKFEGLSQEQVDTLLEELHALVRFNREKVLRGQRRNVHYLETLTHFR